MFKVGDVVKHTTSGLNSIEFTVIEVSSTGLFRCQWKKGKETVQCSAYQWEQPRNYTLLTGARTELPAIDWTKPIQFRGYLGNARSKVACSAKFIGFDGEKAVVWYADGSSAYTTFMKDGTSQYDKSPYIENVPPPPVWPVTKYFALYTSKHNRPATCMYNTREQAERSAEYFKGVVQEVIFNGPSGTQA